MKQNDKFFSFHFGYQNDPLAAPNSNYVELWEKHCLIGTRLHDRKTKC